MEHFREKPAYGKRLLPKVLDDLAASSPERIYASIARSSDVAEGFHDVTFRDMANAVNFCAHWIHGNIGQSTDFETIAYLGISDLCGAVMFLAAVKCGYKVLLLSPRNSVSINVSLTEQTDCTKLFYSSHLASSVKYLQTMKKDLKYIEILSFDEMISGEASPCALGTTFEETKRDPVVILHSSGSTGIPKPIVMTHGTFATMDNDRNLPKVEGRKNLDFSFWDSDSSFGFFSAFPPSHLAGFLNTIVRPIFGENVRPVLGPPQRPPSGSLISEVMRYQDIRGLYIPPSIAEQLLQQPNGLDHFKKLKFLCYAGGPLSPSAGEIISQVTQVCQFYGSTETSLIQQLAPSREDWHYMEWHPSCNLEMEPSEDEAYEMVLHTSPKSGWISALSYNFPDIITWRTRDLFRPHPNKPGLWRFHGRRDDIIVLSNSEKFNPVPMETIIQGHPLVSGALIVGQGRFQAALLIEPKLEVQDPFEFKTAVWSFVEKANCHAPGQARIVFSKTIIAGVDKPFQRAAKGTVVRKLTERSYASEIEAVYAEETLEEHQSGSFTFKSNAMDDVKQLVCDVVMNSFPGPHISNDVDLYVLGLDSLKTAEIAGRLRRALQRHHSTSSCAWLTTETVYRHPTINQLSEVVCSFLNAIEIHGIRTQNNKKEETRAADMALIVEKYTRDLPKQKYQVPSRPEGETMNIALTGSSGFLGCHLLRTLLRDSRISKVYCLDRSPNVQMKHKKVFSEQRDLLSVLATKVHYLTVVYGHRTLGLTSVAFKDLEDNVDIILHNAWKVDFNHSLQSFEDTHIRGIRHLLDWSINSVKHPRIVFISSVASVSNWTKEYGEKHLVPEAALENDEIAGTLGYGESKHVAERILTVASDKCKLPISVLRVGQIAGSTIPEDTAWPMQEWVPSLIKSSKSLELLPDDLSPVNWIPVNHLAVIILEIVHSDNTTTISQFYNLVNPHSTTWNLLLDPIKKCLGPKVKTVRFTEWISKLSEHDCFDEMELADKPALKLMGFLEKLQESAGLVKYETQHSTTVSSTFRSLQPIKWEWFEIWLKQWGF